MPVQRYEPEPVIPGGLPQTMGKKPEGRWVRYGDYEQLLEAREEAERGRGKAIFEAERRGEQKGLEGYRDASLREREEAERADAAEKRAELLKAELNESESLLEQARSLAERNGERGRVLEGVLEEATAEFERKGRHHANTARKLELEGRTEFNGGDLGAERANFEAAEYLREKLSDLTPVELGECETCGGTGELVGEEMRGAQFVPVGAKPCPDCTPVEPEENDKVLSADIGSEKSPISVEPVPTSGEPGDES